MFRSSSRVSLIPGIPVFAVMALLISAADVLAQKKATTLSNEQLAESIVTLRSVKRTLEAADHDYGGHRASAVHHVKLASHELKLALDHVHKGKSAPKAGTDVGSSNESQPLSNAQLAATIPALKQTHKLLQQGDYEYGGHRAKAVTHLGTAIKQLEKALVYIKSKDAK